MKRAAKNGRKRLVGVKNIAIAIDGPAAAGKSTVAKKVAEHLTYTYIDTGAMYRALTWKALKEKLDMEDEAGLADLLMQTKIKLHQSEEGQAVLVDGQNVTKEIRENKVTNNVSSVASHATVRKEMVKRQQELSIETGVVMDGRDIGTHVLPNAEVKIFLIASVEERAERRFKENLKNGYPSDFETLKEEIEARDKQDSEREYSPLIKAEDAIEIDTTSKSIDDVTNEILEIIEQLKKQGETET